MGSVILTMVMIVLGMAGALFHLFRKRIEKPLLVGLMTVIIVGTFSGVIQLIEMVSGCRDRSYAASLGNRGFGFGQLFSFL